QVTTARSTSGRRGSALAELSICGNPETTDPAGVIGIHDPAGNSQHDILAQVPRAAVVVLAVHQGELGIHPVGSPLAVNADTKVRRGEVAAKRGCAVPLHRRLALEPVI